MPLAAGTTLGPYDITASLGAGGMGEVYRACDTRLGRDVAVKVLPHNLASSLDRLTRFEREAAEKAVAIDPEYALAWARLGSLATFENDLAGAAKQYERALALAPNDLKVLSNVATYLVALGRQRETLVLRETIARRDPVNVVAIVNLGLTQKTAGHHDAAIASFRTAVSLNPSRGTTHACIGEVLLLKGAALEEIEQEKTDFWRMVGLPMAYHALGRRADSDAALAAVIAKYEKEGPINIASIYSFRGEADKAFEWLEKAIEYGDSGISEILAERLFDNIHSDRRWLPFLRKIGKAPDQLAKIQFKAMLPKDF